MAVECSGIKSTLGSPVSYRIPYCFSECSNAETGDNPRSARYAGTEEARIHEFSNPIRVLDCLALLRPIPPRFRRHPPCPREFLGQRNHTPSPKVARIDSGGVLGAFPSLKENPHVVRILYPPSSPRLYPIRCLGNCQVLDCH